MKRDTRYCCIALLCLLPIIARSQPPTPQDIATYRNEIRPILEKRCFACHSSKGTPQAGLRLDSKTGWLKGGASGPAITPGDIENSLFLKAIRYTGEAKAMPPSGKMPDSEIVLLTEWVKRGAHAPDDAPKTGTSPAKPKASTTKHWAFQPIRAVAPPALSIVNRKSKIENPIDRFILAKLQAKGLKPSLPADRRTYIRRATFDLHGLPPTPEEVAVFVNDKSANAYEKLIDHLLASPRYGERWGRHWLDVVHYGDTHGYDKDKRRDNAWRYRDYVIRALNADKLYSRFVREQLAGDVLYPDDPDGIVATGFIAAGPWDFVGNVELAEGTVEKAKTRNLDRDDMVANAISTFNSVTIHCARCHDHKFDPIPQRDYYRLQAVFAGVERGDRPVGDSAFLKKWNGLQQQKQTLTAQHDALLKEIREVSSPELKQQDATIQRIKDEIAALPQGPSANTSPTNGYHSNIENDPKTQKWVQVDLGKSVPIASVVLIPARPTDFVDTPGFGFSPRLRVALSNDPSFTTSDIIADPVTPLPNPGNTPAIFPGNNKIARYVRVTALELWPRANDYVFALAEMQVLSAEKNVALGASVTALDSIEAGRWSTRNLTDGYSSHDPLPDPSDKAAIALLQKRTDAEIHLQTAQRERQALADALVSDETRANLKQVENSLSTVEQEIKSLPPPDRVYAVLPRTPRPISVLARGEVEQPKEAVNPGALTCIAALKPEFSGVKATEEGQRRADLADWIVSPKNPLTWRSIVNRVWHYHFGRGIVDTPNDFGKNGGAPTHPELLDWLSLRFQQDGQSLKKLHRLIMLSTTYRQSSQHNATNAKKDSDNRLLWRMNRMRLDAESVRDTVLAVSGKLDLTMGGPAYELFRFKDDHSPIYDHTAIDKINDPKTWRRTVYRFVVRSVPNPFLECLDCADPNINTPVRNTTLTALQSLALLNDPFMITQSRCFADRLPAAGNDIEKQIELAYRLAFARSPKPEEKTALAAYAQKHGMTNACRLLFNMNEFVFVD